MVSSSNCAIITSLIIGKCETLCEAFQPESLHFHYVFRLCIINE